jgi:xanthine dehydrogenase accessory factor
VASALKYRCNAVVKMAVAADGTVAGTTGNTECDAALVREAMEALAEGRSRYIEEPVRAHVDALLPRPQVFIFGAGHIAVPLAHMAQLVGFNTTVIDDRAEFANRERFPLADEVIVSEVERAFADLPIGADSYVVAVTRGHVMDEEAVAGALRARARYVGMIGSRRKVALVRERLRERGFSADDVGRVHAPIGVEINADTIEEIAVSIAAELIAERRGPG